MKINILRFLTLMMFNISAWAGNHYYGSTKLIGKTFNDTLSIMGSTTLEQVNAQSLQVMGSLQFSNIIIEDKAEIKGAITNSKKWKI